MTTDNTNPVDPTNNMEDVAPMSYHDTIMNPKWREEELIKAASLFDWSSKKKTVKKMNDKICARMALSLIAAAGLDDLTVSSLGLPSRWQERGSLKPFFYTKVAAAAVMQNWFLPADFKAALLNGDVLLAGNKLQANYPAAIRDYMSTYPGKPDATLALVNPDKSVDGKVVYFKYVVFGNVSAKVRQAWRNITEGHDVMLIEKASDLIRQAVTELEIGQAETSALIRLHAPQPSEIDADTLKIVRGYDDVLNLKVVADEKYQGYYAFFINGKEMKKYTALSGHVDGLYPYKVAEDGTHDGKSAWKTYFLTLIHVLTGFGKRGMLGRLAYLTDAYLESDTGAHFPDRMEAVRIGKIAAMSVEAFKGYGIRLVNGSGEDRVLASTELLAKGIPVVPHHQMNWVTAGIGAEARGVGMTKRLNEAGQLIDVLLMFSKPDKAEKMLNRLSTSKPTALVENMTRSAFSVKLSNGQFVALEGVKMTLGYANCGLITNLSGKAISSPDFKVKVMANKKVLKAEIPMGLETSEAEAYATAEANLEFPESGKRGDAVIMWAGEKRVTFDLFGATFERVDEGDYYWNPDTRKLEVSVTVGWHYETQAEKFVADGFKFRTSPEEVFMTVNGQVMAQPNALISHEELKGTQALVIMWAEATQNGVIYDPNVGLTEEQQAEFLVWVDENTEITTIRRRVNHNHYHHLKLLYGADTAYKFEADNWVEWTGEMIHGAAVLSVEYSTTFQAEGRSEVFPELLYSLALLDNGFEYMWETKKSRKRRGAIHGLSHMVENKHGSNVKNEPPRINLLEEGAVILSEDEAREVVGEDEDGNLVLGDMFSHGKQYVDALCEKFPVGFYVDFFGKHQYIDPNALRMLTGKAGTLNPVVSNVVDLVRYFILPVEKRPGRDVTDQINSYLTLLAKSAAAMQIASNVMKKPFRVGELLTRKISTTVRYEMGSWELHVNPNDPLVLDGTLTTDQKVGASRVPVFFWGACKVVLDEKTPIGVFEMDPYCWAALNEGDSDGDGIAVLILSESVKFQGEVIYPQEMLWNACHVKCSRMSASGLWYDEATGTVSPLVGGYTAMYGTDVMKYPYMDFLRQKAKKDIANLVKFAEVGGDRVFNVMEMPVLDYIELMHAVLVHYSRFVGASYGISAIALYLLSLAFDEGDTDMVKDLLPLVVFTSRFMHEGKHLGGANSGATLFWEGLESMLNAGFVVKKSGNTEQKLRGTEAMRYIVEDLLGAKDIDSTGIHLNNKQLTLLLTIRKIALVGNKVDREDDSTDFNFEVFNGCEIQQWARLFRLCRLVGKGAITRLNPNEQLQDSDAIRSALEGGDDGHALVDRMKRKHIDQMVPNTLLGKVAKCAYGVHKAVVDSVRQQILRDESDALGN